MHRSWLWLWAVLFLASCSGLNSHSACYVLVWNAVVACWPEPEPGQTALPMPLKQPQPP